jgi:hypothetical protein
MQVDRDVAELGPVRCNGCDGRDRTHGTGRAYGGRGSRGPSHSPATLADQAVFELNSTFTTSHDGKLYLTYRFDAGVDCFSSPSVWWWIELDGKPVQSSLSLTATGGPYTQTLVGVSDAVISPGEHAMHIGAMCVGGNAVKRPNTGAAAAQSSSSAKTSITLERAVLLGAARFTRRGA